MSLAYRLMYALHFAPWDRDAEPGPLRELLATLPPGRALDLGAGLGGKALYMARQGWRVTGVEAVPRAVRRARERAARAGVEVDFREGDVTRLEELGLGASAFDLVFDFGCFHGLNDRQRDAYARGVDAAAAPGARLLMMGFTRALPPVPSGVSGGELTRRLGPGWRLLWERAEEQGGTNAMRRAAAAWFCLGKEG